MQRFVRLAGRHLGVPVLSLACLTLLSFCLGVSLLCLGFENSFFFFFCWQEGSLGDFV